jgi:uncharacterized caspase-like protein
MSDNLLCASGIFSTSTSGLAKFYKGERDGSGDGEQSGKVFDIVTAVRYSYWNMDRNVRQRQAIRQVFEDADRPLSPQEVSQVSQTSASAIGQPPYAMMPTPVSDPNR